MEGLDNQVDCGWCKVMQMNKLQFDQQKIIQAIQQCIKTNEIVNSIAEEGGFQDYFQMYLLFPISSP